MVKGTLGHRDYQISAKLAGSERWHGDFRYRRLALHDSIAWGVVQEKNVELFLFARFCSCALLLLQTPMLYQHLGRKELCNATPAFSSSQSPSRVDTCALACVAGRGMSKQPRPQP